MIGVPSALLVLRFLLSSYASYIELAADFLMLLPVDLLTSPVNDLSDHEDGQVAAARTLSNIVVTCSVHNT